MSFTESIYRKKRRVYFIVSVIFTALWVIALICVWFAATDTALEQSEPCACECGPCSTLCSPIEQSPTCPERVSGLEAELKLLAKEQDGLLVECVRVAQDLVTCRTAQALRIKNNK